MKNKVINEIHDIAVISFTLPTFITLAVSPLWWDVEPLKVFAAYLLGMIATAAVCAAISIKDEMERTGRTECGERR